MGKFEVEARRELATSLWGEGKYREARALLREARRDSSDLSADVTLSLDVMLAIILCDSRDYFRALHTLDAAGPLVTICRDEVLAGKFRNTRGLVKKNLRDYDGAFLEFSEALDCHERAKAFLYAAQVRNNTGNLYTELGLPREALSHFENALLRCDEPVTAGQILDSRAKALLALGRYDEARRAVYDSLDLLKSSAALKDFIDESYRTLGVIDYAEARGKVASLAGARG